MCKTQEARVAQAIYDAYAEAVIAAMSEPV